MAVEEIYYGGKEELTMAQYEALTTLEDNVDYNITDYPDKGITNAQMTFALTCVRLFNDGEIFTCNDNGEYKIGHTYKIVVSNTGTKSWEDITGSTIEIDNISITKNTQGQIQAVAILDTSNNVTKIHDTLTQEEFDALTELDPNTYYPIEDGEVSGGSEVHLYQHNIQAFSSGHGTDYTLFVTILSTDNTILTRSSLAKFLYDNSYIDQNNTHLANGCYKLNEMLYLYNGIYSTNGTGIYILIRGNGTQTITLDGVNYKVVSADSIVNIYNRELGYGQSFIDSVKQIF